MFSRLASRSAQFAPHLRAFSTQAAASPLARFGVVAGASAVGAFALTQSRKVEAGADVDYEAVKKTLGDLLEANPDYDDGSFGPLFIRLAWHASGTYDIKDGSGGSNGATMRFSPEADWGANAGLHIARNLLEPVKKQYPGITYADLWTLAGVVAVEEMGGPTIPWAPGRTDAKDGSVCVPDGRLPDAAQGAQHLRDIFYKMGMDDREIVALSGAHTFGRCHTDRSGYWGPWVRAPTTFSNLYFKELTDNTWTPKKWGGPAQFEDPTGELMMLPTDLALTTDPEFKKVVATYSADESVFAKDFSAAFGKLLANGVPGQGKSSWTPAVILGGLYALASSR